MTNAETERAAIVAELATAVDELHGCMIRKPGPVCEVRKEFLATVLDAIVRGEHNKDNDND